MIGRRAASAVVVTVEVTVRGAGDRIEAVETVEASADDLDSCKVSSQP